MRFVEIEYRALFTSTRLVQQLELLVVVPVALRSLLCSALLYSILLYSTCTLYLRAKGRERGNQQGEIGTIRNEMGEDGR